MRKRIIIGALAVITIGVLAFVLSPPEKGSVAWHKQRYLDARMRMAGYDNSLADRARRIYTRVTGRPVRRRTQSTYEEMNGHKEVLLDLGFLAKREIPFGRSTAAAEAAIDQLRSRNAIEGYVSAQVQLTSHGSSEVTVILIAPASDLPKWEALIRKGSMPQTEK